MVNLSPDLETQLIEELAQRVKRLGLITPAIIFLESNKPFSFIGSQALLFFQPLLSFISGDRLTQYAALFANRDSVERLLDRLDALARGDHQ